MSQHGRGGKATAAQRAEVRRPRAAGVSVRQIAARVFGDAAYRARVERILRAPVPARAPTLPPGANPSLENVDFSALGETPSVRLLFERTLRSWAESGRVPSMSELRSMLEVQRRLEAVEFIERQRGESGSR